MDISLIEFIVYGLVGYTGIILLIATAFRDAPSTKSQSIVRSIYLSISMISIMILAGSGVNITTETMITNSTLINVNTTETWTEAVTMENSYALNNPVWIPFHYMLAVVLLVYIILQILTLFTKVN